jgi:hypothetical protein
MFDSVSKQACATRIIHSCSPSPIRKLRWSPTALFDYHSDDIKRPTRTPRVVARVITFHFRSVVRHAVSFALSVQGTSMKAPTPLQKERCSTSKSHTDSRSHYGMQSHTRIRAWLRLHLFRLPRPNSSVLTAAGSSSLAQYRYKRVCVLSVVQMDQRYGFAVHSLESTYGDPRYGRCI